MIKLDIDFDLVLKQAALLAEVAESMENLSSQSLEQTLQNVSGSWKGENATAYLGKGETLKGNMTTTAKKLKDIATSIENRAKFIYAQEQKAAELARTRVY